MESLRELFSLSPADTYLNGASRSPQLVAAAEAARQALRWREGNSGMPIEAFFGPVSQLRSSFARLINSPEPDRVALIPAASYGIATVAKNLPLRSGQNIIVVQDQFPSNYYAWQRLCTERGATLITVQRPTDEDDSWSDRILDAINEHTAAVAIGHLHWSTGTVFDLEAIRNRTDDYGAWLVVDGTQSLGAYPFDVQRIRPDAVVAGGYKWLLGPYGCGYAWYGPRMDDGVPLEENWIHRKGSDDFSRLSEYQDAYRPLATRYSVGESSNFIMVPMQQAGLDLVNSWAPDAVQRYTQGLWTGVERELVDVGVVLPHSGGYHLVGLRLPSQIDTEKLKATLADRAISVSYRGPLVRVSPHVYNTPDDMGRFAEGLRDSLRATRT